MFTVRLKGIFLLFSIAQIAVTSAVFWLLYAVYNHFRFDGAHPHSNYIYAWIIILTSFGIEIASRSKKNINLNSLSKDRILAVCHRQSLFPLAFLFGFLVMMKSDSLSRMILLSFFAFYLCWIFWTNLIGHRLLVNRLYRDPQKGMFPVLLVGTSKAIKNYIDQPDRPSSPGTKIVGVIQIDDSNPLVQLDIETIGRVSDMPKICENLNIKAIICIGASDQEKLVEPIQKITSDLGIRDIWLDDVEEKYGRGSIAGTDAKYSIISPSREPLEDPINRAFKRLFDIGCALVGIVMILPSAILFVAFLHRRHSRGPLFYRQERSGRHGETFQVTKFRSMITVNDQEFIQAKDGDSRIFKGGDFIRKYSIDELPQLLNVLTGQMSIVGPRPHPLKLDEELAPETQAYRMRHQAKPGITGLAQSRGWRGETCEPRQIDARVKMDLFYIRNWSLLLDVRIVIETVWQLISPPKTAR